MTDNITIQNAPIEADLEGACATEIQYHELRG